jgi:hypothetical protein
MSKETNLEAWRASGLLDEAKKPSKYQAVPTIYNGVRYASKAEAYRAEQLDNNLCVRFWLGQPRFRLGCPENVYIADFLVVGAYAVWVEDVKGHMTDKFKRDLKLWAQYGPCDLHIIGPKSTRIVTGGRA